MSDRSSPQAASSSSSSTGRARRLVRLLALAPTFVVVIATADEAAAQMRGSRGFGGYHGNASVGRSFIARPYTNRMTTKNPYGFRNPYGSTPPYGLGKARRTPDTGPRTGEHKPPRKPHGRPPRHRPPVIVTLPPLVPPAIAVVPPVQGFVGQPPSGPPSRLGSGPASSARLNLPAADEQRYAPDEVLVSFSTGVNPQAVVGIAQGQRLALLGIHRLALIDTTIYRFRITDGRSVPTVIAGFGGDRRIARAQPNYLYAAQQAAAPVDTDARGAAAPARLPGDPAQYVLAKLRVPEAHALSQGGRVLVAVIDSSIDAAHPDLHGIIAARFDTVKTPDQPHRHGTAMAGAIAANGKLLGIAPAARILAARAFDPTANGATGTTTRLLDSLQWAADSGARIVNMSFAGPSDPRLRDMIAAARRRGITLIAAAGNEGPTAKPAYPAAYPEVIAVTATDPADNAFRQSNRGRHLAVAAPGVDIFVAAPDGAYDLTSGTSVAAAHVSGIAALLLARQPGLSPDALQAILLRTAKDLGTPGRDEEFGAGLVNAYDAVNALAPRTADRARAN